MTMPHSVIDREYQKFVEDASGDTAIRVYFGPGDQTITGNLTVTGDLEIQGSSEIQVDEVVQGTMTIDNTDPEAFLVRKDSDGGDIFIVDTTNEQVEAYGMLDLCGGTITILAGADGSNKTRTDETAKAMRFAIPGYLNGEKPSAVIYAQSLGTGAVQQTNSIAIGGGTPLMNAATVTQIYAADDATTITGTEVARFEGGAAKALMMGLGNSSLAAWHTSFTALQIGHEGSLFATTTTDFTALGSNVYVDGSSVTSNSKRIAAQEAGLYYITDGSHTFRVAGSAAADSAITWTTALNLANDGSATFGGDVSLVSSASDPTLTIQNTGTDAGDLSRIDFKVTSNDANTKARASLVAAKGGTDGGQLKVYTLVSDTETLAWTFDQLRRLKSNGAGTIITDAGLLTLDGGTAGVRLNDVIGIDTEPSAAIGINMGYSYTIGENGSAMGLRSAPVYTTHASGTHAVIANIRVDGTTVVNSGATVTNLASLYIDDAPTFAGTVTNGPYSIFVDAGDVRFDGGFSMGGGEPQAQQAHIADVTSGSLNTGDAGSNTILEDMITKFNTLLADLEGFGFLATS